MAYYHLIGCSRISPSLPLSLSPSPPLSPALLKEATVELFLKLCRVSIISGWLFLEDSTGEFWSTHDVYTIWMCKVQFVNMK